MLNWPCRAKFREREYYSIESRFSSANFPQNKMPSPDAPAEEHYGLCGLAK
jgi:hypothetical protein